MWTVTLTFDLVTWFLFATHSLFMMIICAKLFSNPTLHNKLIGRTWTGFTKVYAQSLSADCDLDLATWFLFATYRLVIMIICAKLFSNPTMHNEVMGQTQTGFTNHCHLSSTSKFPDFSLIFPDFLQFSIPSDRSKKKKHFYFPLYWCSNYHFKFGGYF